MNTQQLSQPFTFLALAGPEPQVTALFKRCFGSAVPDHPLHFVAQYRGDHVGYVHYTEHKRGVFLCGGLCVDIRVYRKLTEAEREAVRVHSSLSRWLLDESIRLLRGKQAVFAYTGNTESRRDGLAAGFIETGHRYLLVQWHNEDPATRGALVREIARLGPF